MLSLTRQEGSAMLVVLVMPAVLMIGALLLEPLERKVFTPPDPDR